MKIGLFGFGKAGRAVASVLFQHPDVRLEWIIRRSTKMDHRSAAEFLGLESDGQGIIYPMKLFMREDFLDRHPVDAIIDFSSVESLDEYGEQARKRGIAIVSAISAYPKERIAQLKEIAKDTRVMWSPNITVGINFLIMAAKVLKTIAPYTDIEVMEEHFKTKPETSGTAKIIARKLGLEEEGIKSVRAGGIIGNHEIIIGFPYQTIRLRHESITREAFGAGALFAVQHLMEQPVGFYNMEDLMIDYFANIKQVTGW